MTTKVSKWGNSLAVRIPSHLTHSGYIQEGMEVDVSEDEKGILIRPIKHAPSLSELVAGITDENLHGEQDLGESVGKEAW